MAPSTTKFREPVIHAGSDALNIEIDTNIENNMIGDSFGNVGILQSLLLKLVEDGAGIEETQNFNAHIVNPVFYDNAAKCNSIAADFFESEVEKCGSFDRKWRVFLQLGVDSYLMAQNISGQIKFAPLFIVSFSLLAPHHLLEAEKFNIRFTDPTQITNTADKLRWYRYRKALLQREVAVLVGIDRNTYIHYESGEMEYYPLEIMEKIAALYDIPVTALLDEYNTFLYHDQGAQIKVRRNALNMTQREFADYLGVSFGSLQNWEQNNVRMFKRTWERYFK